MKGKLCGHYPTNGNERQMNRSLSPRIYPELVAGAHLAPRTSLNNESAARTLGRLLYFR